MTDRADPGFSADDWKVYAALRVLPGPNWRARTPVTLQGIEDRTGVRMSGANMALRRVFCEPIDRLHYADEEPERIRHMPARLTSTLEWSSTDPEIRYLDVDLERQSTSSDAVFERGEVWLRQGSDMVCVPVSQVERLITELQRMVKLHV